MSDYIITSPQGTTRNPLNIAGCKLWLNASNVVLAGGSSVQQMTDLSGNGNHAVQLTGDNQPLKVNGVLNGEPVIRFDGVNDYMTSTFNNDAPNTIFIIYKINGDLTTGNQNIIDNSNGGTYRNLIFYAGAAFPVADAISLWDGNNYINSIMNPPVYRTYMASFNDAISTIYQDASLVANGNITSRTSNGIVIGSHYNENGNFLYGNIAEVLIYTGSLSSTDRQQVENYLITKYNTTTSLNKVPLMTSNTTPSGVASASSEYGAGYEAFRSFNGNSYVQGWFSAAGAPQWLSYKFATAKTITKYSIQSYPGVNRIPKTWTFEGSNDNSNWTVLDTRTNYTNWDYGWKLFEFTNTTSYLYYRINVSVGADPNFITIPGMEMFEN